MFPPVQDVLVLFLRAVTVAILNNRSIVSAYTRPCVRLNLSLEVPQRLAPTSHADNCNVESQVIHLTVAHGASDTSFE